MQRKNNEENAEGLLAKANVNGSSKKGDSWNDCVLIIVQHAFGRKLRRKGDYIMEPHPNVYGAFVEVKDVSDKSVSSEKYINGLLRACEAYNTSTQLKRLQTWFHQTDHVSFPIIYENDCDRLFTAFRDGYVNRKTREFYDLARFRTEFGRDPLCLHCFDVAFADLDPTQTPAWDALLAYQFDADVQYFLEVFVGRLGFHVTEMDNWEIAPYFFGLAGTGKSTILRCLGHMYPTASINSRLCNKFGLGDLRDKGVVIIPDVSEKLSKQLDQADIQSMITGEQLTTDVKHKASLSENWRPALALAGNVSPFQLYKDTMGQMSRRLGVFCMLQKVNNVDDTLWSKIKQEVPAIWYRCLHRYHEVLQRPKSKGGIWEILPKQLTEWREFLSNGTGLLKRFIESGTLTHRVVECKGHMLDPEEFQDHFKKYCRQFGFAEPKAVDKDGLSDLGFTTKRFDLCSECLQLPKMKGRYTGCCNTTRKQLVRIRGLKLVRKVVANTEHEAELDAGPSRKRENDVVDPLAAREKRPKVRDEAQGVVVVSSTAPGGASTTSQASRLRVIRVPRQEQ